MSAKTKQVLKAYVTNQQAAPAEKAE